MAKTTITPSRMLTIELLYNINIGLCQSGNFKEIFEDGEANRYRCVPFGSYSNDEDYYFMDSSHSEDIESNSIMITVDNIYTAGNVHTSGPQGTAPDNWARIRMVVMNHQKEQDLFKVEFEGLGLDVANALSAMIWHYLTREEREEYKRLEAYEAQISQRG